MKKNIFRKPKWGISVKTSVLTSAVVLFFLTVNSFMFFNFEFGLTDFIFEEYVRKVDHIIDEQAEFEKNRMDVRIKVDTDICGRISEKLFIQS